MIVIDTKLSPFCMKTNPTFEVNIFSVVLADVTSHRPKCYAQQVDFVRQSVLLQVGQLN